MTDQQNTTSTYTVYVSLIVALGGFLMGFDASVISGVVKFIEPEFNLSKMELGWSVASLALAATFSMMVSGPLSDKVGRKAVLKYAAILFLISAIGSSLAPSFIALVVARMIGGLGVGAALIIAPMYIAEISPPNIRGRMVSMNQLNIVIGISVAFFTNFLILKLGQSNEAWVAALKIDSWNWRWMLGLEAIPAVVYLGCLSLVPESPRWLIMQGREDEASEVLKKSAGMNQANNIMKAIEVSRSETSDTKKPSVKELLSPSLRQVMLIGLAVATLQQITGINSVFFYAPMIFEQSGIGTDASFMQAAIVGLTNLLFTIVAISLIDKIGRKPLLGFGVAGIAIFMFTLSYGFYSATYSLAEGAINELPEKISRELLAPIQHITYNSDLSFKVAMANQLGEETVRRFEAELIAAAIQMNPTVILLGILGFVASFALSIGPVMWVLFSELFPNRVRGLAISFVGLVNSAVSFLVQLIFPWELSTIGSAATFAIYGIFAVIGLAIIMKILPETKGKSLEELEAILKS